MTNPIEYDRDQAIFYIECLLASAVDIVGDSLPTAAINWEDIDEATLINYHNGVITCTGMALAVFYAQLSRGTDGMGSYDALSCCEKFDNQLSDLFRYAWQDKGQHILQLQKKYAESGKAWITGQLYGPYWPDCHALAVHFCDTVIEPMLQEQAEA